MEYSQNISVVKEIYDNMNDLGLFFSGALVSFGRLLFIILIAFAIMLFVYSDDDEFIILDGIIVEPNCKEQTNHIYKCNTKVKYTIENHTYVTNIFTKSHVDYIEGEPVQLRVRKSNHNDATFLSYTMIESAWYMIYVAFFSMILFYINRSLSMIFKPYSVGVAITINLLIFGGLYTLMTAYIKLDNF